LGETVRPNDKPIDVLLDYQFKYAAQVTLTAHIKNVSLKT